MNRPLAIFAPQIGALSETFIQRHMEDLLPDGSVIVAGQKSKPYAGHWDVDCPQFIVSDHQPSRNSLKQQLAQAVLWKLGLRNNSCEYAMRNFLRKHGVQAVLAEYLDYSVPYLDFVKSLGLRFYSHAHGYDISERVRDSHWREEYLRLNHADGIIVMSNVARLRLIDIGFRPDKIHVIPYGVDIPPLQADSRDPRLIRLLAVGRMVNKKAPIFLLESFRRAHEACPSLRLDYVGAGELLVSARQFAEVSGLRDCVTFHGGQPNDFVHALMKQADIFLQHSIVDSETGDEEGLPVCILEAMARALPVVSTRHAGIPEAVEHLETGLLVEEGDVAGMAAQIVRLAGDVELRQRMGAAGRQRAEQFFSWEIERSRLLSLMGLG